MTNGVKSHVMKLAHATQRNTEDNDKTQLKKVVPRLSQHTPLDMEVLLY